jgi:hypothetical protein
MTVLITLTLAGANVGPFNLYSNVDGFTTAFELGVSKAALLSGYSSSLVPDYTTTIRLVSTGECTNYFDILIDLFPTTTTTTTTLASFLYYRTQNGETTPYVGDGCILDLLQSCELQHQNPNPAIVTSGDRVINSPGSGYFDGEGKTYRLQISTAAPGDPSYVVTIDNLGVVNIVTICT